MNFFYNLGFGPASIIVYVTKDVSFNILSLQTKYGSFSAFLIVFMYMILNVFVMCFVDKISLQYNLKANIQDEQGNFLLIEDTKESENEVHRKLHESILTKVK